MKNRKMVTILAAASLVFLSSFARANPEDSDIAIIHLKSKGVIKGIVEEKTPGGLRVDTGFGVVSIAGSDVDSIEYPSGEKADLLKKELDNIGHRQETGPEREKRKEAEKKNLLSRIEEATRIKEETAKNRAQAVEIRFKDPSRIVAETILNDSVKADLVVDTGASLVTISPQIAKNLGFSLKNRKSINIKLADGKMVTGTGITLRSLKIWDLEAKNVPAVVISGADSSGDGLLGMSFLNHFHMKIDNEKNILVLTKI